MSYVYTGCYCARLTQGELSIMGLVRKQTCSVMHYGGDAAHVAMVAVVSPINAFRYISLGFYQ